MRVAAPAFRLGWQIAAKVLVHPHLRAWYRAEPTAQGSQYAALFLTGKRIQIGNERAFLGLRRCSHYAAPFSFSFFSTPRNVGTAAAPALSARGVPSRSPTT